MKKVVIQAPAKLNLALDITGIAPNGYHFVDMIMQAVDIYETVEIAKSSGYTLRLPQSRIPANENNTATKAAAAFFTETGLLAGADIIVHKKVPTRAGMAGGSADAAAVLFGLNALYGAKLSLDELCRIGLLVGADVPFSLLGGTARVTGIGEVLSPLPPFTGGWFVVGMPQGGISTPQAYAKYDEVGSPCHPDINSMEKALCTKDIGAVASHMQNALEHANGGEKTKQIRHLLDSHGALASMMTGSGAAVFGLFDNLKAANHAADKLKKAVALVFVAQPVSHGPKLISTY